MGETNKPDKSEVGKDDFNNLEFGDIIKINFSPAKGHEQLGYRPALVISNPKSQRALNGIVTVVPITSAKSSFFTRVNIDKCGLETTGDILMDQLKTFDLSERAYKYVEKAPEEILSSCNIIFCAIYENILDV